MKVALIGATGFVGKALLNELQNRGHKVIAISRSGGTDSNSNVENIQADVTNIDDLSAKISGVDIVISAYNPGWTNPNIYNDFLKGSSNIQEAVKKAGVGRFIIVGGAGSLFIDGKQIVDGEQFPKDYKAGAQAARDYLNQLKSERDLDWVFVSPAIEMHPGTSGVRKGTYRLGGDSPVFDTNGRSVLSVEDLAVAIVDEAEQAKHHRERFTAAY